MNKIKFHSHRTYNDSDQNYRPAPSSSVVPEWFAKADKHEIDEKTGEPVSKDSLESFQQELLSHKFFLSKGKTGKWNLSYILRKKLQIGINVVKKYLEFQKVVVTRNMFGQEKNISNKTRRFYP